MTDPRGYVPEVEQALLGAILSGGDHRTLFAALDDKTFVEPIHQQLFEAARVAQDRYSQTTIPVVMRVLDAETISTFKAQVGMEIGQYMAEMTSGALLSPATAAKNVLRQSTRIQLAAEARAVAAAAASPSADVDQLLREIASAIDDMGSRLRRRGRVKSTQWVGDAAAASIVAAKEAREKKGLTGITTGLADLNRLTGGLQRGDLVLLGARPSMGKTTLGTSIALSAAKAGNGVGVFSIEMGADKIVTRMLSDMAYRRGTALPYEATINGTASETDLDHLEAIAKDFQPLPIRVDDTSGLTITDIRAKTEKMAEAFDAAGFTLDLLLIDHLLKVRPTSRYTGNRVLELGEITEGVKELAKEFNLSALLLTQLNRAVEQRDDKRPTLSDLRDSGAIEQDADAVLFLYRESYYLAREKATSASRQLDIEADLAACINKAEVEVAKQRNGRIATVELFTEIGCSYFGNAARTGYGEISR